MQKELYKLGPLTVDSADRMAVRDGSPLAMTPKVFDPPAYLTRTLGRFLIKEELLKGMFPEAFDDEVHVAVNISTLRKHLRRRSAERSLPSYRCWQRVPFRRSRQCDGRRTWPTVSGEEILANIPFVGSRNQLDQTERLRHPFRQPQ